MIRYKNKCKNCKYLHFREFNYGECELFGDEIPEQIDNGQGGCCLHYKEKEKISDLCFEEAADGSYEFEKSRRYRDSLYEKYGKRKGGE